MLEDIITQKQNLCLTVQLCQKTQNKKIFTSHKPLQHKDLRRQNKCIKTMHHHKICKMIHFFDSKKQPRKPLYFKGEMVFYYDTLLQNDTTCLILQHFFIGVQKTKIV